MKIHYRSDIHRKVNARYDPEPLPKDCDVIIVAGDIEDSDYPKLLAIENPDKEIIVVMGNHDYWYTNNQDMDDGVKEYEDSDIPNLHILENKAKVIRGITFIGSCGWGFGSDEPQVNDALRERLNDFNWIKSPVWTPERMRERNILSRAFLHKTLKENLDPSKTVVITHFPPMTCVKEEINPLDLVSEIYYNMKMDDEIMDLAFNKKLPKLWIFGHDHTVTDITFSGCRFVSNCYGYVMYGGMRQTDFKENIIVEI